MAVHNLKQMRERLGVTQQEAAARLGVSQAYWSLLEQGHRPLTDDLARNAVRKLYLSPVLLPVSEKSLDERTTAEQLARELASLGYPGFAYMRKGWKRNPGEVLLRALAHEGLEARLAEALPWLLLHYPEMDFAWLVRQAKLRNLTNRLGFVASLARDFARGSTSVSESTSRALGWMLDELGKSRLAEEQTFGQSSMSEAEQNWLRENRPEAARYWNLLTDWTPEFLQYGK